MIEKNGNELRVSSSMLIADATALLEAGRGFLRSMPLQKGGGEVVLDLSAVEETDSSSLGVVFALQRSARERGLALRLVNPPASMISQAGLYGVADTLPLV